MTAKQHNNNNSNNNNDNDKDAWDTALSHAWYKELGPDAHRLFVYS